MYQDEPRLRLCDAAEEDPTEKNRCQSRRILADDLNIMSSEDPGAFDPTQVVGDTSYMMDSSATAHEIRVSNMKTMET